MGKKDDQLCFVVKERTRLAKEAYNILKRRNKMKDKFLTMCVVVAVLSMVATSPVFAALTYLPEPGDLPKTFAQIQPSSGGTQKVESYEDQGVRPYTADVFCPAQCCPDCPGCKPGIKIGSLDFEYSPFKGDHGAGPLSMGGALLRGGFKIAGGLDICPNYTLRWLQYYKQTGYLNKEKIDGNPCYPQHPVAGVTVPLVDFPYDAFSLGAIKVEFESALVCCDLAGKKACYIGSFWWGYENKVAPANSVTGIYPWGWTPGLTQAFKTQFALEYADWTLVEGCCIIPEPTTMIILALGFAVISRRRRAA